MTGTCRSFTTHTQELIKQRMHDVCCGVARMYNGAIDMDYQCMLELFKLESIRLSFEFITYATTDGYPATVNSDPAAYASVVKVCGLAVHEYNAFLLLSSNVIRFLLLSLIHSMFARFFNGQAASRFVGPERASLPQKTMGAEDFSYFLEQRPGWCL